MFKDKEVNENLNERYKSNMKIYLFSELNEEDKKELKDYNLQYLGKNHFEGETSDVVKGKEEDLYKYAEEYLAYQLHPLYLYDEEDFAGEILKEDLDIDNYDLDSFLKDAEVIFVDDAKTFDINKWEQENEEEIYEELEEDYIKEDAENKVVHLRDILEEKPIKLIYVYNEIRDAHNYSDKVLTEDDNKDIIEEDELLFYPDSYLMDLPIDKLHSITNIELLDRIAKSDKSKLSNNQLDLLKSRYKNKYTIDAQDIKKLLNDLKRCRRLFIADRPKNNDFLEEYDLYIDDCLDIIQHLKVNDYYANTTDYTFDNLGDDLIIFEPKDVTLSDGKELGDIIVYIKLNLNKTNKYSVSAISFHKSNSNRQNNLPYKDYKEEKLNENISSKIVNPEIIAKSLAKFLARKGLNLDVSIYVLGKRYKIDDNGNLVFDIDADPKDYFQYVREPNILSMSFEGDLYHKLNYDSIVYLKPFFAKYGLFYELGYAWNLSVFPIDDKDNEKWDTLITELSGYIEEKLIQGKSDRTLKKNIETEIKAGKPPKQAYAIAKSIQDKYKNENLRTYRRKTMNENKILIERSLSRLLTHLSRPDDNFAIIGTQDKDNKKLYHIEELLAKLKNSGYGYNELTGEYTYDDGSKSEETSYIIYGIPREEAIEWARELTDKEKEEIKRTGKWGNNPINQESIIYKDDNFFGFISTKLSTLGQEDEEVRFDNKSFSFDSHKIQDIGGSSRFARYPYKNKNKRFVFENCGLENVVKYECYYIKPIRRGKSERVLIESYTKEDYKNDEDFEVE